MTQLFWKEYRELRLLPVAALIAFVALSTIIYGVMVHYKYEPHFLSYAPGFYLICVAFSIYAGATTVSPEVGSGTLQFMSVLPVSRKKLWWVKLAATVAVVLTTVVTLAAACIVMALLTCPTGLLLGFHTGTIDMQIDTNSAAYRDLIFYTSLVMIGCFSAGMWASPFFDRPVTATIAAVAGGGIYLVILSTLASQHAMGHIEIHSAVYDALQDIAGIAIVSVPYLLTSFQTFTRGESLKTNKRFKVGGIVTAGSLALVAIIVTIASR